MSKAGSGKPNRLPGMRLVPQNGANPPVPDDLVWDAENPPVIFACSSYIVHRPECDETCESKVLDESGTVSQNLAFAYARAGMSYKGIVPAYEHVIPVRGMRVEVFFLECQVQALTDLVCELANITREEFDVKFRNYRNKIMQDVLDLHEEQSRKQRVADQFGVVEKRIYGPDGKPLS